VIEGTQECDLLTESLEEWSTAPKPWIPNVEPTPGLAHLYHPRRPATPAVLFSLTGRSKQDNLDNTRLSQR
jgi:hypothetical protein